jgi:hypothetical protein
MAIDDCISLYDRVKMMFARKLSRGFACTVTAILTLLCEDVLSKFAYPGNCHSLSSGQRHVPPVISVLRKARSRTLSRKLCWRFGKVQG